MTIETQLKSLEDALTAVTTDKESKPRPEEEKQKEIDLKKKEALAEGEKQKETERKKGSAEEEKKKELNAAIEMATSAKDKKIESLTAAVNYLTAKPIIDEMLEARRMAGMQQDALEGFSKSLYGQSVEAIKQRYADDSILFASADTKLSENTRFASSNDYTDLEAIYK